MWKTAQWVKSLLTKPGDLSLILRTHLRWRWELTSTRVSLRVLSHTSFHSLIKRKTNENPCQTPNSTTRLNTKPPQACFLKDSMPFYNSLPTGWDDRCSPSLLTISAFSLMDLFILVLWIHVHVECRCLQRLETQDSPGAGVKSGVN